MKEAKVEKRLNQLEQYGFEVLKLKTPGTSGVMDRMILFPKWSPKPPAFVELKAPSKRPRLLQIAMAMDWRKRGVDVRDYCDTIEAVDKLCDELLIEAVQSAPMEAELPSHIIKDHLNALHRRRIGVLKAVG